MKNASRKITALVLACVITITIAFGFPVFSPVAVAEENVTNNAVYPMITSANEKVTEAAIAGNFELVMKNKEHSNKSITAIETNPDDYGKANSNAINYDNALPQHNNSNTNTTQGNQSTTATNNVYVDTEPSNEPVPITTTTMMPNSVRFLSSTVPFIYDENSSSAPEHGAALWFGTSDVNDGEMSYLIGHNPGDFAEVMQLTYGDIVTLCDANGYTRNYVVTDIIVIANKNKFGAVHDLASTHGECVVLQTCVGDGNVRIIFTDAI